jgi:hypothetical protein
MGEHAEQVTAPGLTVMAVILFMGAISGAHLNPVVTVVGPLTGSLIAVGIAYILRGPGGRDPSSEAAGSGRLMAPEQAGS